MRYHTLKIQTYMLVLISKMYSHKRALQVSGTLICCTKRAGVEPGL